MMMVLGDNRIHAGVQPLNNHEAPSFLNAVEMTLRVLDAVDAFIIWERSLVRRSMEGSRRTHS
jgi:hypothetical protein